MAESARRTTRRKIQESSLQKENAKDFPSIPPGISLFGQPAPTTVTTPVPMSSDISLGAAGGSADPAGGSAASLEYARSKSFQDLVKMLDDREINHLSRLDKSEREKQLLEKKLEDMQSHLLGIETKDTNFKDRLHSKDKELQRIEAELHQAITAMNEKDTEEKRMQAALEELESDLVKVRAELETKNDQIIALEASKVCIDTRNEKLKEQNEQLVAWQIARNEELVKLEAELQSRGNDIISLKGLLLEARNQYE